MALLPFSARAWRRHGVRLRSVGVAAILLLPLADFAQVAQAAEEAVDFDLNFGVFESLSATQERKVEKTNPVTIVPLTDPVLQRLTQQATSRQAPAVSYTVNNTTGGLPQPSRIFDKLANSTLPALGTVLEFLLSGPLAYAVFTNCSGTERWNNGSLRPTLQIQFTGGGFQLVDWERWIEIDCDGNLLTGDSAGADVRVRMTPIVQNLSYAINPSFGNGSFGLNPYVRFLGGLSIEAERMGPSSAPSPPLDLAVFKSFSYDNNNYVWFAKVDLPFVPTSFNMTFTSDEVVVETGAGNFLENIAAAGLGNLTSANYISELRGPYRLGWNLAEDSSRLAISAGYIRYYSGGPNPLVREATWFDVALTPGRLETAVPSHVFFRLDSESFNKSFDFLQWNGDRPARLELAYYDDRENYTYARAALEDLPAFLQATVDEVGSGPNATAKIAFEADTSIRLIDYEEYIFHNRAPDDYIYSHVRLEDVPLSMLINGTLDVGGTPVERSLLRPGGASIVGELIDRVMIRIASKLYSVGQTLRSIPYNILNLPDEKGWVSIDLPKGGEIGLLEFWLTSGAYVVAGGDFVAFYNDTTLGVPPGSVGTSFSGRLRHIEHIVAGFIEETTLTLVTAGNEPFVALFLDGPQNATAAVEFSNLPHEMTLRISPTSLRYAASGPIASLSYTATIGNQYTRMRLADLPRYIALTQTPGDVRIDTLFDPSTGLDSISLFEMQVSDAEPMTLPGDHLLSFENETVHAASARIAGIGSLRYLAGAGGKVALTAKGGAPFAFVFLNRTAPLEAILHFDPLPSSLDVTLPGSLSSISSLRLPSLGELTSVVDFSHIIFGIDLFGRSLVDMLGQVGRNIADGIGRFDQNFSFSFDSTANTTLMASISKGTWDGRDEAPWVHGLRSKQRVSAQNSSALDLNAKLLLTGLPKHMAFTLNVESETLSVNATLEDFTPAFDYLAIETDAASTDPNDQPKDVRFFVDGILPHSNLSLKVDFRSDLSVGGAVIGNMSVDSSFPMKDFYVRLTTKRPRPTAVEVLIPEIPMQMATRAELAEGIAIVHRASAPVPFVLVRMGRGIVGPDASGFAVFHDVPEQAEIRVPASTTFDMAAANPFKTLPNITLQASKPGLDLIADLSGDALGSRGSMRFLVQDLGERLSMIQSGNSYAISSDGVARLLFEMAGFPISRGLAIDATSIYAEDVESVTISYQMVFNAFPILSVDNLNAGLVQIRFEHRISALSGATKPTNFVFVTLPVGGGPISVTSNGIVTSRASSGRYFIVPAPILSFIVSQF